MQLEDLVREWLNKAHEDIRSARYLTGMNPMPVEIIARAIRKLRRRLPLSLNCRLG